MELRILLLALILALPVATAKEKNPSDIENTQDQNGRGELLVVYIEPILEAQPKPLLDLGAIVNQLLSALGIVNVEPGIPYVFHK